MFRASRGLNSFVAPSTSTISLLHAPQEVQRPRPQAVGQVAVGVAIGGLGEHLRVHEVHQRAEQPLIAPMRRSCHKQRLPRVVGEHPADPVVSDRRWSKAMGLVEDDRVEASPVGVDGLVDGLIHRSQFQRHDPGVVVGSQASLVDRPGGDAPQAPAEEPLEVGLPLRYEVCR